MILNNPEIKEAKDNLPEPEQVLAACPIKFLQLDKLIEGFSLFLEQHGGSSSLQKGFNFAQCNKDYAELIGKNYKLVPAWIAQLYSSGQLFGAPQDFLQAILEADSTDRLTRYKSYYAGHRGEKGAVCFYHDLFNYAFYFCGGWASGEVLAVDSSDRQAIINLDALIKQENPVLKPAVALTNR